MMHPHIARLLAQAHVDEMLAAAERHRLRQLASGQQERATEGPSTALGQAGPPGEASHTVRSDGTGRGRRRRPWHPGRIAHVLARRYRHPERPRTDALTVGRAPERRLPRSQLSKVISSTTGASLLLIGAALLIACSSSPHEQTAPAVVPAVPASIPTTDTPPPSGFSAAGNTHLVDYSTNDGPDSTVVLTGAIGDTGQAESVHPDGSVDPDHASNLRLTLKKGSFLISVAALDKQFVDVLRTAPFDTQTCSGRVSVMAAAPIIPGSGTGLYRGIAGSFDLTLAVDEVVDNSSCSFSGTTAGQLVLTEGEGTISYQ